MCFLTEADPKQLAQINIDLLIITNLVNPRVIYRCHRAGR